MSHIDFAIAVSLFLFFFAAIIVLTTNYFSRYSVLTKTSELKPVAESLFNVLLKRKGTPENWDLNYSISPVKVGLVEDLYMIPIVVKETNGSDRINEPVTARITFDENCQNKSWNTTMRMYNESDIEINLEISNTTFCSNTQFLNETNITWEVTISANQTKNYYLYYSSDNNILDPSYSTLTYNTSSWSPNDGDAWTETTTDWSQFEGGSIQNPTNDQNIKVKGNKSVNISDTFSSTSKMGLHFGKDISNISNGWYMDVWLYVDDTTGLSQVNITLDDSYVSITTNVWNNITSATWYHFVRQLDPNLWYIIDSLPGDDVDTFNASKGIYDTTFTLVNTTSGLIRTLKIDGLYFKKKPLTVKTFPEEKIEAISYNKFDTMRNLSYDELKKTIGENYKLSVKIDGETYGGQVNQSANAVCYQNPSIIQYINGTIKKIIPKLCVWK